MNKIIRLFVFMLFAGISTCSVSDLQAKNPKHHRTNDIQQVIEQAWERFKGEKEGANADYIPYLANVPSELFGIAVVTKDGVIYKTGDVHYTFGIESISKIFVLAQAMEEVGAKFIEDSIGVGATGMPFNSVMAIELEGQRPVSPIVNAGAMSTNSLIKGETPEAQFAKILDYMNALANTELELIDELYLSEAETNLHNRGIALLLASYGCMWADPEKACDSYTKQCSVGVTAEELAVMGSVLASGGMHPVSKKQLIHPDHVSKVLAVMGMEGLYERTGNWMYNVGLPAKSGVGGGILAVSPGRMAIVAFAPPLDEAGNSVKAQKAIEYIVQELGLNMYQGTAFPGK